MKIGFFSQNTEVGIRLCRAQYKEKNITLNLHGRFKADRKAEEELQKHAQTTKIFGNDIRKECGLQKCAKLVLKKGKLGHSRNCDA
jgi:hypothetical protein